MDVEEERVVLFYEKAFQRAVNRKGWTGRTNFLPHARRTISRIENDFPTQDRLPPSADQQMIHDIVQLFLAYTEEAAEERFSGSVS